MIGRDEETSARGRQRTSRHRITSDVAVTAAEGSGASAGTAEAGTDDGTERCTSAGSAEAGSGYDFTG